MRSEFGSCKHVGVHLTLWCSRSFGGFDRAMKQMSINKLVWFSDVANLNKIGQFDDNPSQLRVDINKATKSYM